MFSPVETNPNSQQINCMNAMFSSSETSLLQGVGVRLLFSLSYSTLCKTAVFQAGPHPEKPHFYK